VPPSDPQAREWQVRRETYHHLLGHVLATGPSPMRIVDLGAALDGFASPHGLGHHAVAVDAIDDDVDGLGVTQLYATGFPTVQADFDALPFAEAQFDLVVFNRSLHYAADTSATLERAHRLLVAEARSS
jgi:SAM-dependent methyltransferase